MGYPPRKETGVFCCRWSLNRYKYSRAVAIGSLPGSVRCRHSCWDARIPKDSWLSEKGMREQRYTKSENVAGSRAKRTAGSLPGSIHKSLLLEKHFGLWNVFQAVIRTSREAWPQWVIWCPRQSKLEWNSSFTWSPLRSEDKCLKDFFIWCDISSATSGVSQRTKHFQRWLVLTPPPQKCRPRDTNRRPKGFH